jgi:hypothetical protein
VFAGTLLLMLLASINYQLNLGYALTFLLAGTGLVSMHLTHGNAARADAAPAAHAGRCSPASRRCWTSWSDQPGRRAPRRGPALRRPRRAWPQLRLVRRAGPGAGQRAREPSCPARAAGTRCPRWSPRPASPSACSAPGRCGARPATCWPGRGPRRPPPPLPASLGRPGEQTARARRGEGSELDGVRAWRRGDTCARWLWKKVARSGELVSRDTAGARRPRTGARLAGRACRRHADTERGCRAWPPGCWRPTARAWPTRLHLPGRDAARRPGRRSLQRRAALEVLRCANELMIAALATDAWHRLPRDARDTLFQLGVIGWTLLPHLPHLALWCTPMVR